MARYIDADDLKLSLKNLPQWGGEVLLLAVLNTVDRQFTADVVPRERFDRVFGNLKAVLEERSEDKAEVAREIFEEIEKIVDNNAYKSYLPNSSLWCKEYKSNQIIVEIAELKKKYTIATDTNVGRKTKENKKGAVTDVPIQLSIFDKEDKNDEKENRTNRYN